jgi:hypothetical protein
VDRAIMVRFLFVCLALPVVGLNAMELTEEEQLTFAELESLDSLKKELDTAKRLDQENEDLAIARSLQEHLENQEQNNDFEKTVEVSKATYAEEAEVALVSAISAREEADAQEARRIKEEQERQDYKLACQIADVDFDNAVQTAEAQMPIKTSQSDVAEKQEPECWQLLPDEVKVLILMSLPKVKSLAQLFGELARIGLVNSEFHNLVYDKTLTDYLIDRYKGEKLELSLYEEFFDAAKRGYLPVITHFAQAGFDIKTVNESGVTALHYASLRGHKEVAEWLIAQGADVNAKDNQGVTPYIYAISREHDEVGAMLVQKGACIKGANEEHLLKMAQNGATFF